MYMLVAIFVGLVVFCHYRNAKMKIQLTVV